MIRIYISKIAFYMAVCVFALGACTKTEVNAQPQSQKKVIVVGGGISGLIAALKLEENDVDVTLIEKEPQVGGRVYSEPLGGTYANLGAQYFFKSDNEYLNYYIKKAKKFYPGGGNYGAVWDGHFASSKGEEFFLELPIDNQALVDFEASMKKMQETYKEFSNGREYIFDKNPFSQVWMDLDKMSAEQYLTEFHPDVANIYNMFLIPEGGAGVDETSALLLTGWYGKKGDGINYLIEGGNQKLTESMGDDIRKMGGTIHLSSTVKEIVNTESGVKVSTEDGKTYEADYAIVTTPATVTKWIVKDLSEEKLNALNAVSYGASMEVGLHLKNLPKDERISSCIFHNENINAYMNQSQTHLENETVVCINIAGKEVHQMTEPELIEHISITLKKIYPKFSIEENIADVSVKKWEDGIVRYPPGFLSNYQEAIRMPLGNIMFGGDYTHSPALDGAAWSGVRAANQILEQLKK